MSGVAAGVAESLAEAKALGVIVAGNKSKQVAKAAGALRTMREAMGGLGKTAAITIAPFVKMIADGMTEVMKRINSVRETIIDFAYSAEYVFKNFSEYVALYVGKAVLKITEFANATLHIFTDVLPQVFKSFAQMLHEGLASGFAEGFDKGWDKAVAQIKASMARASGEFENTMRMGVAQMDQDLDAGLNRFIMEKKAAINIGGPGASAAGGGSKENSAVERGSAKAFKIIHGDKGDKMYEALNKSIAIQQKMLDEMRKKRAKQPQIVEVGIF